uniref:Myotubularin phosphatase domain-containing protein n=1 Tax=Spongospora subterranea TaxID=70186 RepID=A0A0H5R810_9EUKA|eukprot:CRZ09867.1 hypothetical protein [Spongospora subterranea]
MDDNIDAADACLSPTTSALEPCDDILASLPSEIVLKQVEVATCPSLPSPEWSGHWWAVHDWDSNDDKKLLKGEISVMRVDNIHLILDVSLPLIMAPSGTLFMTTYRLYFLPKEEYAQASGANPAQCYVPLAMIERVEKLEGRWDRSYCLEIHTRDYRIFRIEFPRADTMLERAYNCLIGYIFPQRIDFLFGFFYSGRKPPSVPSNLDGWSLYDGLRELLRLGIPSDLIRVSCVNKQFEVCDSYPSLVSVPTFTSDYDLKKVAQFRKRGRFPILSWKHPTGNASIWRCSQPKVGWNQSRSSHDESMLNCILKTNPGQESLPIFDCRPKMNAVGNKLAGAGFESSEFYPDCSLTFLNIQNIHSVRDSAQKLARICRYDGVNSASNGTSQFINRLDSSNWLSHQSDLLRAVLLGVQQLHDHQQTILVHCSDGWDRTSQITSLMMLCLDSYYRSSEGFMVLIEKEWLACGHKFAERIGIDADYANTQRAPVFLQFIETIWQLLMQFPTEFEFTTRFLLTLLSHVWSGRFGTFFCNSVRERIHCCLRQRTVSLWTYLRASESRSIFNNPVYTPSKNVLYPSASTSKLRFWEEFWLRSGLVEYPRPLRHDALSPFAIHPITSSAEALYQDTIWALKNEIEELKTIASIVTNTESEGSEDLIANTVHATQLTHRHPVHDQGDLPTKTDGQLDIRDRFNQLVINEI